MKIKISDQILRQFGLIVGIGFPIFIGWILPVITGHYFRGWTLYVGFVLIIFAIVKPNLLLQPYRLWIGLGNILGWINSRIILGIIFIIVLQPISIFMKLFGYDPLRKNKNNNISYREKKKNYKIDLNRIF